MVVADLELRSWGGGPSGAALSHNSQRVCVSCSQMVCLQLKDNLVYKWFSTLPPDTRAAASLPHSSATAHLVCDVWLTRTCDCVNAVDHRSQEQSSQRPSPTTSRHKSSLTTRSSTATCITTITTDAISVTMATTCSITSISSRRTGSYRTLRDGTDLSVTSPPEKQPMTRNAARETATARNWRSYRVLAGTSTKAHTAFNWSTARHRRRPLSPHVDNIPTDHQSPSPTPLFLGNIRTVLIWFMG